MSKHSNSIFREYWEEQEFVDRYVSEPLRAIDVIIPVVHTNELWRANLLSYYREIPIRRLLIGDGGCIDDSITIAREFPRVTVLDHREYRTLGYSLRRLIEEVDAEWFTYLHSDVYLPSGWFDAMEDHQQELDWFGCRMQATIMVEYEVDYGMKPWMGAQMGRRAAFGNALGRIDDDYVYRQEEFVLSDVVARTGGRTGAVSATFHYHQTMRKPSPFSRKVKGVNIDVELSREEEIRTWDMQARGVVKYLEPDSKWAIEEVGIGVQKLIDLGETTRDEFASWVKATNPVWLPHLHRELRLRRLRRALRSLVHRMKQLVGR